MLVYENFAKKLSTPQYAPPADQFFVKVGTKRTKSVQDEAEVADPTQTKRFKGGNPEEVKVSEVVHDMPAKPHEAAKKLDNTSSLVIVGMAKDAEGAVP